MLWDGSFSHELRGESRSTLSRPANPGVEVTVEYFPDAGMSDKYLTSMSSGSGPDVAAMQQRLDRDTGTGRLP